MASFEMKNDAAKVVIDEHASEIHSFINAKTGLEYMWQGDPKFWKGRNPTLFPMVGSTWDKILHIDGKEYKTGNHGFTRNSDFTCVSHTDDQIVMELKDRVSLSDAFEELQGAGSPSPAGKLSDADSSAKNDAVIALTELGFSSSDALKAVSRIDVSGMSANQILKEALKALGR